VETNLVTESIKFMILGMSVVFTFLYLLVIAMKLQAIVIERYFSSSTAKADSGAETDDSDEERARVAAIVAAVIEYRKSEAGRKG
jgi:oxaloacetate decarboxylase gamma subunit